jgi:hypothetical protein
MSLNGLHRFAPSVLREALGLPPREPLNITDDAVFERWCALPETDTRTLEEFGQDGGASPRPSNHSHFE